jgi:hypothetical protein
MSSGMAGAKKSTLVFCNVLFHVNGSGFAGAKKGRGIQAIHQKNCFLLCSMLTLVPRKAIRRIRTIIPKESLLFHVKVSVVNCVVRPLLFEGLMNVCSLEARSTLSGREAVFSWPKCYK